MYSQVETNIRNFLVAATIPEIENELELSIQCGQDVRAGCIEKILREAYADEPEDTDRNGGRGRRVGVCSHCQTGSIGLTKRGYLVRHNVRNGDIGFPLCEGSGTLPEVDYYV